MKINKFKQLAGIEGNKDSLVYWYKIDKFKDVLTEGYVGKTSNLKRRKQDHLYKSKNNKDNNKFHNFLKKHERNIKIVILLSNITEYGSELLEFMLRKNPNIGLNTKKGGAASNTGIIVSQETRVKMSKSRLGKKETEETKLKKSKSMKGKNLGKKRTSEYCSNLSKRVSGEKNPNYGKKMSEEQKAKRLITLGDKFKGHNNPNAKLTESDILFIKNSQLHYKELMSLFNVSKATIWRVKSK